MEDKLTINGKEYVSVESLEKLKEAEEEAKEQPSTEGTPEDQAKE